MKTPNSVILTLCAFFLTVSSANAGVFRLTFALDEYRLSGFPAADLETELNRILSGPEFESYSVDIDTADYDYDVNDFGAPPDSTDPFPPIVFFKDAFAPPPRNTFNQFGPIGLGSGVEITPDPADVSGTLRRDTAFSISFSEVNAGSRATFDNVPGYGADEFSQLDGNTIFILNSGASIQPGPQLPPTEELFEAFLRDLISAELSVGWLGRTRFPSNNEFWINLDYSLTDVTELPEIPAPAALPLFVSGALGFGAISRRRRRFR